MTDTTTETPPDTAPPTHWKCNGQVRWLNGTLQQQWYDDANGSTLWRDVPREGAKAPKRKASKRSPKRKTK